MISRSKINFLLLSMITTCYIPIFSLSADGFCNSCSKKIDHMGNIFIVWHENNNEHSVIKARTKYVNSEWTQAVQISDNNRDYYYPVITTDDVGNAFALWTGVSSEIVGNALFGAVLPYQEEWKTPKMISDGKASVVLQSYDAEITNGNDVTVIWNESEIDEDSNIKNVLNVSENKFGKNWKSSIKIN